MVSTYITITFIVELRRLITRNYTNLLGILRIGLTLSSFTVTLYRPTMQCHPGTVIVAVNYCRSAKQLWDGQKNTETEKYETK